MFISCKVCTNKHLKEIDRRIIDGDELQGIYDWLDHISYPVSYEALLSHSTSHVKLKPQKPARKPLIDFNAALQRIQDELLGIDVTKSVIEGSKITQVLLERIHHKHLVIVDDLLEKYAAGSIGYPKDEIKGLKEVSMIINSIPLYSDKGLQDKIVKDQYPDGECSRKDGGISKELENSIKRILLGKRDD